jgi:hypothetical protein
MSAASLAAARFAGDAEHLARAQLKGDAVDGLNPSARACAVVDTQVLDVQNRGGAHRNLGLNTLSMAVFTM